MITIKKILCPVDFSVCSAYALNYAIDFSMKEQALLYLLYVVEMHADDTGFIIKQTDISENSNKTATIKARLMNLVPGKIRSAINLETMVVQGIPFIEIIKVARNHQVDLIVLGTHGRTGLRHILIGSVAERVIQKAPCPVLSIKLPE
ncbi:MAG: universal stress protein [Candidatus Loosdrechtia sp.]|uniref:universal stress protein n=1 Tax=Candidatus Loosdrechtia sp. TaxID=3101272 RepID=UPI003A6E77F9|nr:MAG: universal stress protein [Candidatus Jettenia sp. AMX2]